MKKIILWLLGFSLCAYGATLEVSETTSYLKASPFMEYYADTHQTLRLESIDDAKWQPMRGSNLGGMNHHASWTRFHLRNTSPIRAIYILKNPRAGMDKIDVHIKRENGEYETIFLGDQREISKRDLPHRYSIFSLVLTPNESVEIISKLSNAIGATEAEWEIYSENEFPLFSMRESLWWGLCAGFSFALFLYSFPIMKKQGDSLLVFFFGGYILFSLLYQNALNGTLHILGLSGSSLNIILIFCGLLFGLFTTLVMLRFLMIMNFKQGLVYYSMWSIVLVLGVELIYLVFALKGVFVIEHIAQFANAFAIGRVLIWFGLFLQVLKFRNHKVFLYLFLGHSAVLGSYLFSSLYSAGILENSFMTSYGLSIGTLIESYCFALSIGAFIDTLEEEKARQDKLIKIHMRFTSIGRVIANIAHQWKIPLVRAGGLLARTEGLIYFEEKNIAQTLKNEIIPQLRENFDFMQKTIDDFYALYDHSAQKTLFYPEKELKGVWEMLSAKAVMRNITLDIICEKELQIRTFEHHFCHLLMILLDNAIETAYERKIKNPRITVTIDRKDTTHLQLIIEDTCGGITQKPIASIFEFESSRQKDEKTPRGIGLFMVKMLLETFFQGTIGASNTAHGAHFHIIIPYTRTKEELLLLK